ncbi:PA14 domain-containing protein [Akkermansia glycaniphila]|nr:PA14 domain-containing protein [Akkermansia glycaniphila]OCA02728.1 hypothetical protein AC781_08805 [Akkermansia glycaniphila]
MWGETALPINQTHRIHTIMAISTKPFHPLDAENNRRYKVTDGQSPQLAWNYSDDLSAHDWAGYLRIPETGNYTFRIQVDDNGFIEIDGKKVVEVTGSNASTSREASLELKKGFHYAKFHHENLAVPEEIAGYPNAAQFESFVNGERIRLKDIDAPENIMSRVEANKLLGYYMGSVDYVTVPTSEADDIWKLFGDKAFQEMAGKQTCATRLSIALSRYGFNLSGSKYPDGSPASNNVENLGWSSATLNAGNSTPPGKHIIMSAEVLSGFLKSRIMKDLGCPNPDYVAPDDYSTPQEGDIVIFGDSLHVGLCPGDNQSAGSFLSGGVWLLYRSTLDLEL